MQNAKLMRSILKHKSMNTLGQLGGLQSIVLALVIIGVLLGAAFLIMADFQSEVDSQTGSDQSVASQAVNDTVNAINKVPAFLGIIALVVIVAILLVILFNSFPRTGT